MCGFSAKRVFLLRWTGTLLFSMFSWTHCPGKRCNRRHLLGQSQSTLYSTRPFILRVLLRPCWYLLTLLRVSSTKGTAYLGKIALIWNKATDRYVDGDGVTREPFGVTSPNAGGCSWLLAFPTPRHEIIVDDRFPVAA